MTFMHPRKPAGIFGMFGMFGMFQVYGHGGDPPTPPSHLANNPGAPAASRKNEGLQRVSLLAEHANVHVEDSENLKWNLAGLHVDPDLANALRNQFIQDTDYATIRLAKDSDPVYVIHNWYDMQRTHA